MNARLVRGAAGVAGLAIVLALWELAGRRQLLGPSCPPLSSVLAYLGAPANQPLLLDATARTAGEASSGFLAGAVVGVLGAMLALLIPACAPGIERLAAVVNGIPIIAIGSVCAVTFPAAVNPVIVAALGSFFVVFVTATSGFAAASSTQRDLFAALGASGWTTFLRLRIPVAFPEIAGGLRAAAPIAVVGAIIGEWFAAERGIGPLLFNAMQNYQTTLLWSAALLSALLSACAYFVLGLFQRAAARRYRG